MKTTPLYDKIGTGYDATRKADAFLTKKLFQFLTPQSGNLFLDIGCGTGNYTVALSNMGLSFYGVEPSEEMLTIAKQKKDGIVWLKGAAEQIPLGNNLFNGAIATLTIHHWVNLTTAFHEIARVLKPEGKLVIFTALPEQMEGYWLNHYFPKMLQYSIMQMPGFHKIEEAALKAGFLLKQKENYFIHDNLEDNFLYVGKNRPHLYLNEQIRTGISSFAALANKEEVEYGLSKLKIDLSTNQFEAVKASYENQFGDYLFILFQKGS